MTSEELLIHWGKAFKIESLALLASEVEDGFYSVVTKMTTNCGGIEGDNIGNLICEIIRDVDHHLDDNWYTFQLLLYFTKRCLHPSFPDKEGYVSIIANEKHRATMRRTEMKVGKFVKLLYPPISDVSLEQVVNEYKLHFRDYEYEYVEGKTQEDFYNAYTAKCLPTIDSGSLEAFLCDSCMQHDYWPIHPAKAYASGDFTIASLWYGDKIAARTILSNLKPIRAPIYTTSLKAHQKLVSILKEKGYEEDYGGWEGHRLLILQEDDTVYAPYLDFGPCGAKAEGGVMVLKTSRQCSSPDYYLNESNGEHTPHRQYEEEDECF